MYNYNFGKLENDNLIYAPYTGNIEEEIEVEDEETGEITIEKVNVFYSPLSDEQLVSLGYKPIILVDPPADDNIYQVVWVENTNDITQTWVMTHETTNKERREYAYETRKCVEYDGLVMTIDEANQLYMDYFAEGNLDKATTLSALIKTQKDLIREEFPDEV